MPALAYRVGGRGAHRSNEGDDCQLSGSMARTHAGASLAPLPRALCGAMPQEPRAAPGRPGPDETTAGPYFPGLRQSAHQWPPGRAGRAIRADGSSHAPGPAPSATAGHAVADAHAQPGRSCEAATGRTRADEDPGRRWDGRADRGGEGRPAYSSQSCLASSADCAVAR